MLECDPSTNVYNLCCMYNLYIHRFISITVCELSSTQQVRYRMICCHIKMQQSTIQNYVPWQNLPVDSGIMLSIFFFMLKMVTLKAV